MYEQSLNPNNPSEVREMLVRQVVGSAGWGHLLDRLKEEADVLASGMSLRDDDGELLRKARNWLSYKEAIQRLAEIGRENTPRSFDAPEFDT